MDWEACNNKRIAKSIKPDLDLIASLKKSSNHKLISMSHLPMQEETSTSKVSLMYDSIRELLEALSLQQGFKIYNHECYTAFLRQELKESTKADDFDGFRKTRNSINYYGKELTCEEANNIIQEMKTFRTKLLLNLKKEEKKEA